MITGVEREQRAYLGEDRLSRKDADGIAFSLMVAFKAQLNSLDQFREGSSDVFLNLTGDWSNAVKKSPRVVKFSIGDARYQVDYSSSKKAQRLTLLKDTFGAPEGVEDEDKGNLVYKKNVVILQSRRFIDQKPIWFPKVRWCYSHGSRVDYINLTEPQGNSQVNNDIATGKTLEMLAGLTPQK